MGGLNRKQKELGWLIGYTKLTDTQGFGTMLIYITGDNRQSLMMLCDVQKVVMLRDEHNDSDVAIYRKEGGGYYLYTANYGLYAYVYSSSYDLKVATDQNGNGLIKLNRA